jgi:hypothetical protein
MWAAPFLDEQAGIGQQPQMPGGGRPRMPESR